MTAKKNAAVAAAETAPIKRGRGRPATGKALSDAERKAQQRKRDRARTEAEQTLEALLTAAGQAIQKGDTDALKSLTKEMQRRAKLASI